MRREDLSDLVVFLAIVDEGSFTRAALRLDLSQSALSHTMRRLEERLGVRLLNRSTRNVTPTEAGAHLIETLRPAMADIDERFRRVSELGGKPVGTIRITTPGHAARTVLWPAIKHLVTIWPGLKFEIDVDGMMVDLVAARFDCGIRLGEAVAKDMIAVRIGPPLRMAAVASPDYLAKRGVPVGWEDLAQHECINVRFRTTGVIYPWEFERDGHEHKIKVDGRLVLNDIDLMLDAARSGMGVAFMLEDYAKPDLASGALVQVLEDWCEPFDGYYLYYPSRRQSPRGMELLIEELIRRRDRPEVASGWGAP